VAGRIETEETPEEGADTKKPFLLRIPAPLMADLRAWAAQEVRSLNGQIEFLLREAVRARRKGTPGR
jgi:hypothetical protein